MNEDAYRIRSVAGALRRIVGRHKLKMDEIMLLLGLLEFEPPAGRSLSFADLAEMIGMGECKVSRAMEGLVKKGVMAVKGGAVSLRDAIAYELVNCDMDVEPEGGWENWEQKCERFNEHLKESQDRERRRNEARMDRENAKGAQKRAKSKAPQA